LQYVARRVDRAYQNFFRRIEENRPGKQQTAGFPRFKLRQRYHSITYLQSGFDVLENCHLKLSNRIFHCNSCDFEIDRDLNAATNIHNQGLEELGRGTPEVTPVEIGTLPAMATPVREAGSPRL
jgi:transposase